MRLYVPTNSDKLRLTSDWKFTLYSEAYCCRNQTMFERLQVPRGPHKNSWGCVHESYPAKFEAVLPAGTVLQVDRVYIRKSNATAASVDRDFDSITFFVIDHPTWKREGKKKVMARFWAKLRDVNTIEFEHAAPPRWSQQEEGSLAPK